MTELDENALEWAARAFFAHPGSGAAPLSALADAVRAYLHHSPVPAGYRLVPIEPTREMLEAGKYAIKGCPSTFERDEADVAYRAMLSAAPTPPVVPAVPDDVRAAVETVLRLDKSASEGPWAFERCGEKCNDIFIGQIAKVDAQGNVGPLESGCVETTDEDGEEIDFYREAIAHIDDASTQGRPVQDAALIASFRTLAPLLARHIKTSGEPR